MQPNETLIQANALMQAGDQQQATTLIEQVLSNSPNDAAYANAASIYRAGHLYNETLTVFQRYKQSTGKDLDQISNFTFADVQNEQIEYQKVQPAAAVSIATTPLTDEQLKLWPLSFPYDFFMLLFVSFGVYLIGLGFTLELGAKKALGIPILLFGLYMIGGGVIGMLTYIEADSDKLVLLATRVKVRNDQIRLTKFPAPKKRTILYSQIGKASVETFVAYRGVGVGLKLDLKDGSSNLVNLGPFLKSDCRNLVLKLRSKGVFVTVSRELLGKDFLN